MTPERLAEIRAKYTLTEGSLCMPGALPLFEAIRDLLAHVDDLQEDIDSRNRRIPLGAIPLRVKTLEQIERQVGPPPTVLPPQRTDPSRGPVA